MSFNNTFTPSNDQIDEYAEALKKLAVKIYNKEKWVSEVNSYELAARILAAHIMRTR